MGFFRKNKAEQDKAEVIKKVEEALLMKQLVPEAKKLAEELGLTEEEALIYLKNKAATEVKENEHKSQPKSQGFNLQGLWKSLQHVASKSEDIGGYGNGMQQMGTNLMNIGLSGESEEGTQRTSRGRGQRKTKRTF